MSFLHLHVHTDRSQFDGLLRLKDLIEFSKKHSLGSVCSTDHGNMSVAVQLDKKCKEAGLKPIFGTEAYIVDDKSVRSRESSHIILLAKNEVGFRNLVKLNTLSFMYFYYVPRIDLEALCKYSEGLIVLSACIGGILAKPFLVNPSQSMLHSNWQKYYDIFGDDFYVEIQPYNDKRQRDFNNACVALAKEDRRFQLVVTGDCHYYTRDDQELHRRYVGIKFAKANVDSMKSLYQVNNFLHVRTMQEMVNDMSSLHNCDVTQISEFRSAFLVPFEIDQKIESFELRHGVKIPRFKL